VESIVFGKIDAEYQHHIHTNTCHSFIQKAHSHVSRISVYDIENKNLEINKSTDHIASGV
jgi:hypothetical protein